ncbi:type VII secretion integral membrane protein EccD [Actinoplanes sp. NPDC051861]|uniref:type VII secretion integral membrane protein EccD n=1 Tax=Actinoplanes sp. NPDC051861 TaxID=3155170 RepID=UPI003438716C
MSAGLARVTIDAPQRRVDVTLPEHVPLAELLPDVLRHAGEGLADEGEKHGGWLLRRADGVALQVGQGLHPQGVRDGEVLHLVPADEEWPEPDYEDVVEVIAEGARRRGGLWTPTATRRACLVAAAVPLLPALLAAGSSSTGWVALGLAGVLTLTGTIASRGYADRDAGLTLAAYALPFAFVGAALTVTDALSLTRIGAPELLAGSAAVLVCAALGGTGVAAGRRFFTAAVTAGLLGALTALIGLAAPPVAAAAALIATLVCGIAALPMLATRLGHLPRPPIPVHAEPDSPTGLPQEPTSSPVDRAAVFAAVDRSDDFLGGMLLGHAVLAVGALSVLAFAGTLPARVLIAVSAVALLLRGRIFLGRSQRIPLLVGGLFGLLALLVDLLRPAAALLAANTGTLAAAIAGATLVSLLIVVAGATYAARPPSPYLSRAADLLDATAVIAVIPTACFVAGLYTAILDLT